LVYCNQQPGIFFDRLEISRLAPPDLARARMRIGMVYQDAALLSSSTVRENLALPLQELTDKTPGEIDRIVDEKLDLGGDGGHGRSDAVRTERRNA
jgi:phospholipid/cholesterol/gamma-HCH transport system ATP-binding protein